MISTSRHSQGHGIYLVFDFIICIFQNDIMLLQFDDIIVWYDD